MAAEQVRGALLEMLREVVPALAYEPGKDDAPLADLGVDSLDVASFCLKIEETYGVPVSDEELEQLVTLNDYAAFVEAAQAR